MTQKGECNIVFTVVYILSSSRGAPRLLRYSDVEEFEFEILVLLNAFHRLRGLAISGRRARAAYSRNINIQYASAYSPRSISADPTNIVAQDGAAVDINLTSKFLFFQSPFNPYIILRISRIQCVIIRTVCLLITLRSHQNSFLSARELMDY